MATYNTTSWRHSSSGRGRSRARLSSTLGVNGPEWPSRGLLFLKTRLGRGLGRGEEGRGDTLGAKAWFSRCGSGQYPKLGNAK